MLDSDLRNEIWEWVDEDENTGRYRTLRFVGGTASFYEAGVLLARARVLELLATPRPMTSITFRDAGLEATEDGHTWVGPRFGGVSDYLALSIIPGLPTSILLSPDEVEAYRTAAEAKWPQAVARAGDADFGEAGNGVVFVRLDHGDFLLQGWDRAW